MSEHIWETFDQLFRTAQKQARRIDELEERIAKLEAELNGEREAFVPTAQAEDRQALRMV